jgi:ADP-ribose pyrophosphatase YjhB (NUDIX family)
VEERTRQTSETSGATPGRRHRFERPRVAVDTVIFAVDQGRLKTYLVQLKTGPLGGKWAFPGGLVRVGELLDAAAGRELHSTTGLDCAYLEQLFTFGDPSRDPRSHVVSVAYMALISDPARIVAPSGKYAAGGWFDMADELPPLAYDHTLMARYALSRLKAKLEYTNIAAFLLPASFTFNELEHLVAAILGRNLDRRNFRRRILAMGLLKKLAVKRRGPHRPAALYSFLSQTPQVVQML